MKGRQVESCQKPINRCNSQHRVGSVCCLSSAFSFLLFLLQAASGWDTVLTGERQNNNKQTADGIGYLNNTKASKW